MTPSIDGLFENSLVHGRVTTLVAVAVAARNETGITVIDDGALNRDADPFAAARADGHGIGLKLARSLAETERGSVQFTSHRPATFELRLPSADPTAADEGTTDVVSDPHPMASSEFPTEGWTTLSAGSGTSSHPGAMVFTCANSATDSRSTMCSSTKIC